MSTSAKDAEIQKKNQPESEKHAVNEKDTNKKEKEKTEKEKPKTEIEKLRDELDKVKKQLAEKEKAILEEKSRYAFLQAELENTRKYYLKQQEIVKNKTQFNTIAAFTPVLDSLENAIKNRNEISKNAQDHDCQIDNLIKGFENLYHVIRDIFKTFHVEPIETINIPFDYHIHESVLRVVRDDIPEDTVLQIIQRGFRMNGEVIRPAKVLVSKHTPPPPPPVPAPSPSPSEEEKPSTDG